MKQIYAILLTFLFSTIIFGALHYYSYGKLVPDKLKMKKDSVAVPEFATDAAEQVKESFYGKFRRSY